MLESSIQEKSPWRALFLIILYIFLGLVVFQFIGVGVAMLLTGNSLQDITGSLSNPLDEDKYILLIIIGVTNLGSFILVPLFYIWQHESKRFSHYFHSKNLNPTAIAITFIMMLAFMMVNSLFIEWNMKLEFPDFMSGFATWARAKEDELEQLTKVFIAFDSLGYFLFVFLIVAGVAAFGEELLFRGLIQNQVLRMSGNVHVAIWLSALFFSAFHIQFFGFVPRLLLGAFFGYLYAYSGNLFYPILAHFINNGFTLIMIYLYQQEVSNYDIEQVESLPSTTLAIAFMVGSALFYLFYKQFHSESEALHG